MIKPQNALLRKYIFVNAQLSIAIYLFKSLMIEVFKSASRFSLLDEKGKVEDST